MENTSSVSTQDSLLLLLLPGKQVPKVRAAALCPSSLCCLPHYHLAGKMTLFRRHYVNAALSCLSAWAANTHSHILSGPDVGCDSSRLGWFNHCSCTTWNRPGGTGCSLGNLLAPSSPNSSSQGSVPAQSPAVIAVQTLQQIAKALGACKDCRTS